MGVCFSSDKQPHFLPLSRCGHTNLLHQVIFSNFYSPKEAFDCKCFGKLYFKVSLLLSNIRQCCSFTMCVATIYHFSSPGTECSESNINNEIWQKDSSNNYLHPTSYSRSQVYKKPAIIFIYCHEVREANAPPFIANMDSNLPVSHIL